MVPFQLKFRLFGLKSLLLGTKSQLFRWKGIFSESILSMAEPLIFSLYIILLNCYLTVPIASRPNPNPK
jgi:hypothetical protein